MSVRITAAGAVAVALTAFFTAPVSACDERFIKRCEKASAAAAASADAASEVPVVKRKPTRRVTVVVSRTAKPARLSQRTRAPGFTVKRERSMTLASADSRVVNMPRESALMRRFRGFIDPQPIAQNAFEALRKPHLVAENLELPHGATMTDGTDVAEAAPAPAATPAPAVAPAPAPVTATKQDRAAPKAPAMELASAESKPVVLPEPPPPARASMFSANAAPAPVVAPQAVVSEAPAAPAAPSSPFQLHHLVIALCGALGAAGALRFVVGA